MVRSRRVAHKIKQISARRRLVRNRPEVTKVPPDVDQFVPVEFVAVAVPDQLQVWTHGVAQSFDSCVGWQRAETLREFSARRDKVEDGTLAVLRIFHPLDEARG